MSRRRLKVIRIKDSKVFSFTVHEHHPILIGKVRFKTWEMEHKPANMVFPGDIFMEYILDDVPKQEPYIIDEVEVIGHGIFDHTMR